MTDVVSELHELLGGYAQGRKLCTATVMRVLAIECGALLALCKMSSQETIDTISELADAIELGYTASSTNKQLIIGSFEVEICEERPVQ